LPYGMRAQRATHGVGGQTVGRQFAATRAAMPMGSAMPGMGAPPPPPGGAFGAPPPAMRAKMAMPASRSAPPATGAPPSSASDRMAAPAKRAKDDSTLERRVAPPSPAQAAPPPAQGAPPPAAMPQSPAPAPWREEKKEAQEQQDEGRAGRAHEQAPLGKKPTYYQQVGQKLKKALGLQKVARGRFAITADSVIVELTVPVGGLDLAYAGADVVLTLDDGSETSAGIMIERSTHEGTHVEGLIVRIVLAASAELAARVTSVRVELANGIVIEARI
jgi:hypothetical protein